MSKYLFFLSFFLVFTAQLLGQSSVNQDLRIILYKLASSEMQGRDTGTKGQKLAAGFIANYFQANNVFTAYNTLDSMHYLQQFIIGKTHFGTTAKIVCSKDTFSICPIVSISKNSTPREINLSDAQVYAYKSKRRMWSIVDCIRTMGKPVLFLMSDKQMQEMLQSERAEYILKDSMYATKDNKFEPLKSRLLYRLFEKFNFEGARDIVFLVNTDLKNKGVNFISGKAGALSLISNQSNVQLHISGNDSIAYIKTENVISTVPNKNSNAPWLIIGAHYDHIGIINNEINFGADDNASGTAALMVLASHFANNSNDSKFNLMFIAFSAEEHGLLGSKYFIHSDLLPKKIAGMINMDMIGRTECIYFEDNYLFFIMSKKGKRFMQKTVKRASFDDLTIVTLPPEKAKVI